MYRNHESDNPTTTFHITQSDSEKSFGCKMHQVVVTEQASSHHVTTTHRLSFGTDESPLKYFVYRNGLNDGFVAILQQENPLWELWGILCMLAP